MVPLLPLRLRNIDDRPHIIHRPQQKCMRASFITVTVVHWHHKAGANSLSVVEVAYLVVEESIR